MSTTPELERLQEELRGACDGDERRLYALFDGARLRGLPVFLHEIGAGFESLYRGKPAADLAHVAPYLVKLPLTSLIIPWLLVDTQAAQSAVFLVGDASPADLHRHLRRYLIVLDPRGCENFFRFYDPRVLAPFLDACTPEEAARFFGPIRRILVCASVPPVKAPVFRTWTPPSSARSKAPPSASDKFVLRPEHEQRFAQETRASYEQRCVTYLKAQHRDRLQDTTDQDVRQIVERARDLAGPLGITAGRDITVLAEVLTLGGDSRDLAGISQGSARERSEALVRLREQLSKRSAQVG